MATYTLRQLKYFVTTVECGSVAEASRKLYIAQPSISTAIKGLEESFGLQLFIRHHAQGVSLTPGGARFYKKAQELMRMAREFEQNALADNDVVAGQVTVAVLGAAAVLPHIKSGKLVALAVSTRQRSPMLPDTPTLAESGAGDIDVPQWSALFAVAGAPAPVIARLRRAVDESLAEPTVAQKLAGLRSEPPRSLPSARGTMPEARAAAAPPLLPTWGWVRGGQPPPDAPRAHA